MRLLEYPYWMLEVDGSRQVEAGFMPGVVSCRLPPGQHTVAVTWVGNPLAAVGQIIAALTIAGLFVVWRRQKGRAA
jgi:hypothetical protein